MGAPANLIGERAASEIVALREAWHTKNHPFYLGFHDGGDGSRTGKLTGSRRPFSDAT